MATAESEHERLLQFLYVCPVGIAELGGDGSIRMLNAVGAQLLAEICLGATNLLEAITDGDSSLRDLMECHAGRTGAICNRLRLQLPARGGGPSHLELTMIKLDDDAFMAAYSDVTELVAAERTRLEDVEREARHERERELARQVERELVQRARLEMATTILHDIGNAITGMSTRIGNLIGEAGWPEHSSLRRLLGLVQANQPALDIALPGKGQAITDMLRAIDDANQARFAGWQSSLRLFGRGVLHIREIVALHRGMVPDGGLGERAAVDLREVLSDAMLFTEAGFAQRGVRIETDVAAGAITVSGDRTRLTQVVVNLLKNACEAFDALDAADPRPRTVKISLGGAGGAATLAVRDNGAGLNAEASARLFTRGGTSKANGSGIGLASSLAVARAHGGSLELHSDGPGQGATAILVLGEPVRNRVVGA